jgi:putative membrane protein
VAIKHYLRGEEGIHYVDLYHLVKFLPQYWLPPTIPSPKDISDPTTMKSGLDENPYHHGLPKLERSTSERSGLSKRQGPPFLAPDLPFPNTSSSKKASLFQSSPTVRSQKHQTPSGKPGSVVGLHDEGLLLPARMPPKYSYFDLFPFSFLVRFLTKDGKQVKGKKAARLRAKMQTAESQNLPLEISLYLVCNNFCAYAIVTHRLSPISRALTSLLCKPAK